MRSNACTPSKATRATNLLGTARPFSTTEMASMTDDSQILPSCLARTSMLGAAHRRPWRPAPRVVPGWGPGVVAPVFVASTPYGRRPTAVGPVRVVRVATVVTVAGYDLLLLAPWRPVDVVSLAVNGLGVAHRPAGLEQRRTRTTGRRRPYPRRRRDLRLLGLRPSGPTPSGITVRSPGAVWTR